jgi:hypothetical protein
MRVKYADQGGVVAVLDLEPHLGPACLVGAVSPLAHDAFQAQPASGLEYLPAVTNGLSRPLSYPPSHVSTTAAGESPRPLAGQASRTGSTTTMKDCKLMRIDKNAMMLALHRGHTLSELFVAHRVARNIRYQEDLVDQLFNFSEKRLVRILLLLAHFGEEDTPPRL